MPRAGVDTYQAPVEGDADFEVVVNPESHRLQLLTPFAKWNGEDITVGASVSLYSMPCPCTQQSKI